MHKLNKDSKIIVLAGGISQERDVSLRSGKNVYEALIRLGYNNSTLFNFSKVEEIYEIADQNIDLAVLMTHGKFGEDGELQAMLDGIGIKYTGSSASVSKTCMDKVATKKVLKANNLPVLETYSALDIAIGKIKVTGPLIMKEIDGGSSIGITKYNSQEELQNCHPEEQARLVTSGPHNQNLANFFVEKFITGTEITASIIELGGKLQALPLLELRSKNEFYDYQAKYTEGMTEFILPAQISDELTQKVKDLALKAYQVLGCSGPARVDFIIDGNHPYILEVNTLPGMTNTSDLPAQARAAGIGYDQLVELIIGLV